MYEYAYVEAYSLAGDLASDAFDSIDFVILTACEMHILYGLYVNPTDIHIYIM